MQSSDVMGSGDETKCVFPLNSLKIGDLQSYLSGLSIFLGNETKNIYILVDNRPRPNPGTRSAHFWQLKSRTFPSAKTKGRAGKKKQKKDKGKKPNESSSQPNSKENKTGFIVFEVEWANVRGINYLNELQTDTSLAIEAKLMRRWEFESINQAVTSMSQWFSGSKESEWLCLREYLDSAREADFSTTSSVADGQHERRDYMGEASKRKESEYILQATEYKDVLVRLRFNDRDLPFKLREVIMADTRLLTLLESGIPSWALFLQSYPGFSHLYRPWMSLLARALHVIIPVITVVIGFYDLYKNVPVLKATAARLCGPFFDWIETWDMVSRIKYLGTMLFLHNFQKAVNWALKVAHPMQSFVSLRIMPLVKPFLEVLGFLLRLWNSLEEKVASLVSMILKVITYGRKHVGYVVDLVFVRIGSIVSPVWKVTNTVLLPLYGIIWKVLYTPIKVVTALAKFLDSSFSYVFDALTNTVLLPLYGIIWKVLYTPIKVVTALAKFLDSSFSYVFDALTNTVLLPLFGIIWKVLYAPIKVVIASAKFLGSFFSHIFDSIRDLWRHMRTVLKFASDSQVTVKSLKTSMWRTLWNELFSHVFHAIGSILKGFVTIFSACNRHRLSTYNHIQDCFQRLHERTSRSESIDSRRAKSTKNHQLTASLLLIVIVALIALAYSRFSHLIYPTLFF